MQNILLTGGSGDIGAAIGQKFIREGCSVIAPSRTEMDLLDMVSIDHYMEALHQPIHAFVHCAGINFPKPFETIAWDDLYRTMQINAFSFYRITQHLVKGYRAQQSGFVLGVSSIYGSIARKGRFSYTASKYCLRGMVKSLALELGAYNVKCNSLSPGFVDTKLTRQNNSDAVIESLKKKVPLNRLAHVNDIADAAYFLCSDQNRYINGQDIIIDGGYTSGGFQE